MDGKIGTVPALTTFEDHDASSSRLPPESFEEHGTHLGQIAVNGIEYRRLASIVIAGRLAKGRRENTELAEQLGCQFAVKRRCAGLAERFLIENGVANEGGDSHTGAGSMLFDKSGFSVIEPRAERGFALSVSLPLRAMSFAHAPFAFCRAGSLPARGPPAIRWPGFEGDRHPLIRFPKGAKALWAMGFQRESAVSIWSWFRARKP
jgi:hypothetical protein